MIDGMMGRLGETVGLSAGDQRRETTIPSGPKGVNLRNPRVAAGPSPGADRCVDAEFRSPTATGASDSGMHGGDPPQVTLHVLDGRPRGRQFPEESPRWEDVDKRQIDQEWQAGAANEDHARSPRLSVVVPLNEQVVGTRETDQTVADDRASVVQHSALEDVSPSDADSVGGRKKS